MSAIFKVCLNPVGIRVDNILKSVELLVFFLPLFILLMKYVRINTYMLI